MKRMSPCSFRFLPVSAIFVLALFSACDRTADAPVARENALPTDATPVKSPPTPTEPTRQTAAPKRSSPSPEKPVETLEKKAAPIDKVRTLDDVIVELSEKWTKIKSLSAEVKMVAKEKNAAQNLSFGGYGDYACIQKDGRLIIRTDVVNTIVPNPGESTRERKSTILVDGEITYMWGEEGGKKFAQKRDTDHKQILRLGGRALFDQLNSLYELTLEPNLKIDGHDVYLIAGTPRGGPGRCAFLFDREMGVMRRMRSESESGQSTRTMIWKNFKINPGFDESHFEFRPPEGVPVFDLTRKGTP
ncbi:MAG: hypothetical protein IH987_15095 [Planctomycetes bacterium]|nr:hypothetical protein [Planctomycetota bacterium]